MNTASVRNTRPFAAIGLVLGCYAVFVEYKMEHKAADEDFTALCDIEMIGASCSDVFRLPEGRMLSYFGIVPKGSLLDVPNAAIGSVYYAAWLLVVPHLPPQFALFAAGLAMSSSVFLAAKLFVLKELCVLCWSTHIINARLLYSAVANVGRRHRAKKKPQLKQV